MIQVPSASRFSVAICPSRAWPPRLRRLWGAAPQGPTGVAQLVTSWVEFAEQFGGLDGRSYLGFAVFQFFANGGGQAYIVRIPSAADGTVLAPASTSGSSAGAFEAAILPGSPLGVDLLESVDLFNFLCVPGEADPATLH